MNPISINVRGNKTKGLRPFPSIIVKRELAFQIDENEKRTAELIIANKELASQNVEKEKRAAELKIANKELTFQNAEKEKRAAELIIANFELAFQNHEKEKRAAELVITNERLVFKNQEIQIQAARINIANRELVFQIGEKEKSTSELIQANLHLKKADEFQKEYIKGLEQMTFMASHHVRKPIANILGIVNQLEFSLDSPEELILLINYLKASAVSLDVFTRELTDFLNDLEQKGHTANLE